MGPELPRNLAKKDKSLAQYQFSCAQGKLLASMVLEPRPIAT